MLFKVPFLVLCFSYHTLMILLIMLSSMLLSIPMILFLYSKCDHAYDLQQQLEFASGLQDTMDWSTKCVGDFNAGKPQFVFFTRPDNCGAVDAGLRFLFSSGLDEYVYIISVAKFYSKKLELWFILWNLFPLRLPIISLNLLYELTWNTVVMSELVLLVTTCIRWIS